MRIAIFMQIFSSLTTERENDGMITNATKWRHHTWQTQEITNLARTKLRRKRVCVCLFDEVGWRESDND